MIKKLLLVLLIVAIGFGVNYCWQAFPIISGYGAKNLCSCYFLGQRDVSSVLKNELGSFPLSIGLFEVDEEKGYASGSVFGLAKRKAIYKKGTGCTLLVGDDYEITEEGIQNTSLVDNQDTIPWPNGNLLPDSLPTAINIPELKKVIDHAFKEVNPKKPQNTRSVAIVYNGQLIAEQYAEGFDESTPQIGWSMSKSITNALIGILVMQGKLNVQSPAPVVGWTNPNDPRREITLDHLLRMSSGLAWEENYGGPSKATNMLFKNADMGAFASKSTLENPPGEVWYYSSGTSNIVSKIIRQSVLPEDYPSFPKKALFQKIGMHSALMEKDASGTFVGSSYTYATLRDWARFGLLYYYDGVWNEERILPEGWVKYTVTPTVGSPMGQYGAHFWLNAGEPGKPENRRMPDVPSDMFSANGFNGQRVFIIPSEKLVVVRMGLTKRGNFDYNRFLADIIDTLH